MNRLANSHENIYLFDTYKVVCPDSICSFTKNGIDIYDDDDHLSYGWAREFLAPKIYKFISDIQTIDKWTYQISLEQINRNPKKY